LYKITSDENYLIKARQIATSAMSLLVDRPRCPDRTIHANLRLRDAAMTALSSRGSSCDTFLISTIRSFNLVSKDLELSRTKKQSSFHHASLSLLSKLTLSGITIATPRATLSVFTGLARMLKQTLQPKALIWTV
jgi:hypothetical protein